MLTLGLNTTSRECSVAVCHDSITLIQVRSTQINHHSDVLIPMILESLDHASHRLEYPLSLNTIDRFGVSVGPGSFTGIRIGLATARGFRLATGRPVYGFSTFELLAHNIPIDLRQGRIVMIAITIQKTKPEVFVQGFSESLDSLGPIYPIENGNIFDTLPAKPIVIAGDGAPSLATMIDKTHDIITLPDVRTSDAACIAKLVATRSVFLPLRPIYLSGPVKEVKSVKT